MNLRARLAAAKEASRNAIETRDPVNATEVRIAIHNPTEAIPDPLYRVTVADGSWSGLYRLALPFLSQCFLTLVSVSDGRPLGIVYVDVPTWRSLCETEGRISHV